MADDFNVVNDTQSEAVDTQSTDVSTGAEDTAQSESDVQSGVSTEGQEETNLETESEVADPKQSREDNARFAQARREAEAQLRQEQSEKTRLLKALESYGYSGSASEIADVLEASKSGKPIEVVRAEREKAEQENIKISQLEQENQNLKKTVAETIFEKDLRKIKEVYPDLEAKSINDLGDEFKKIMATGLVDAVGAYEIMQKTKERTTKKAPPVTSAVNQSETKEKSYYTPAEVDKLTAKDYDNPKIMQIVRESMTKWKK